jgi:hypothetical protein
VGRGGVPSSRGHKKGLCWINRLRKGLPTEVSGHHSSHGSPKIQCWNVQALSIEVIWWVACMRLSACPYDPLLAWECVIACLFYVLTVQTLILWLIWASSIYKLPEVSFL